MSLVLHEPISEKISKIILNDPENLNAMGEQMAIEFKTLVNEIAARDIKPRVIIISGAGRAFSAGGNLEMLENKQKIDPDENRRIMMDFYDSFLSVLKLNIPLIAAINGPAVGAGLCLACACDIRLATKGAKLGFTFTKLGLHPGMGATYFLPKIIGYAASTELLLSGRVILAEEALEMRLVNKLCEVNQIIEDAEKLANQICDAGPQANALLLQSLRNSSGQLEACLAREAVCQSYSYASSEFKEGVRAAIEKRKANFD